MGKRDDVEAVTFSDTTDIDLEVEVLTEAEYKAIMESYPGTVGGTR
jgi:hypothetical protein